ncbi:protein transport protein sec61 subunit gamma [Limosa lapponica baueri]|uniref:Protein transport protein sec61 subunit gamma n=1 Tax=Limosa lapponica baueri TaxID=1758121 RepID=A0A2I0T4D3_LIMLA|nr:protein transport protein sec61 subunit gamma [Limosa lapponica baueri]
MLGFFFCFVFAEFQKIAMATAIGFAIMGFIGFFVKLIHIPINNIIVIAKWCLNAEGGTLWICCRGPLQTEISLWIKRGAKHTKLHSPGQAGELGREEPNEVQQGQV